MTIEEQKTLKVGDRIWHTGMSFEGKFAPFEPCWFDITLVTERAICGRPEGRKNMQLCILHDDNPVDNKARTYYSLTKPVEATV